MDLIGFPRRIASALSSRLKRPSMPRPERAPEPHTPAALGGPLRAFRAAALLAIGIVVTTADIAAFTESYKGLFDWGESHGLSGFWAAAFPLQVDLFIVVGELVLFIAMLDRWNWKDRLGAWAVAGLGLAVSIAGNIGHVAAHDLQSRGTAAVPPVAAFGALWLGLGVLKRILRHRQKTAEATAQSAQETLARDAIAEVLAGLTDAVSLLAGRAAEPAPEPARVPDHSALLGEILQAVREIGARPGDAPPAEVPADAEHAALIAMKATHAAGNPLPQRQLEVRFGLTRAQATRVREMAGVTERVPRLPRLAELNGAGAGG